MTKSATSFSYHDPNKACKSKVRRLRIVRLKTQKIKWDMSCIQKDFENKRRIVQFK